MNINNKKKKESKEIDKNRMKGWGKGPGTKKEMGAKEKKRKAKKEKAFLNEKNENDMEQRKWENKKEEKEC